MNRAAKYVKIVEWSEEDDCFVGSCPGLLYGGCQIVEETVNLYEAEGRPLPPITSGYDWANASASAAAPN